MRKLFKPLIFIIFTLSAIACEDKVIEPVFEPFRKWESYGTGYGWYYQPATDYLMANGIRKTKKIENPVKTGKGSYTILITAENQSTEPAAIKIWVKSGRREENIGTVQLLPGLEEYEVELTLPMDGHLGLEATGGLFNFFVRSIEFH